MCIRFRVPRCRKRQEARKVGQQLCERPSPTSERVKRPSLSRLQVAGGRRRWQQSVAAASQATTVPVAQTEFPPAVVEARGNSSHETRWLTGLALRSPPSIHPPLVFFFLAKRRGEGTAFHRKRTGKYWSAGLCYSMPYKSTYSPRLDQWHDRR
ncbi:hypothetical protein BCV70DRAFT_26789 [Testicularia cyperi]|uniref:Uncharacterized protein n=1 Tax=Testicularia cyperi TaxID=1882483 RepID=A0A317XKC6_9BASI|nr:hypothetical protein BCV70DRAFT_26789 [Testicularia cyperi]